MSEKPVQLFFNDLDRWRDAQEALLSSGGLVALEEDWLWIRHVSGVEHWYAVLPDGDGRAKAGAAAQRLPTRSFPGHYRLRVTRFGHGLEPHAASTLLEGFRALVEAERRLLSVNVELFAPDAAQRDAMEEAARRLGYEPSEGERRYRWTARLDLARGEQEIFDGFTRSCRRAVREPEKKGYRIAGITEDRWVPRMEALWRETFRRTGARPPPCDWVRRVAFARSHPDRYRIVGAFAPDPAGAGELMAFACAMYNGDHAVYSEGASTREEDARTPLSYAPVWEIIRWARDRGCRWFDMGGIPRDIGKGDDDPRGGIADFKLRFTKDVVEVGSEWAYRPPSLRSWLSDGLRRSGRVLRGILQGDRG